MWMIRYARRGVARWMAAALALLVPLALGACGDDDGGTNENQTDPCAAVDCGIGGQCVVNAGQPACDCDAGHRAEGLQCVPENRPPRFTNLPTERIVAVGGLGAFPADATDLDAGDTLTYEITGSTCSFDATVDPATGDVEWRCGPEETCRVFMQVTDDGTPPRSDTGTLYISCAEGVPEFRTTPLLLAHEHEEYRYDVRCRDPFGGAVTLTQSPEHTCPGDLLGGADGDGVVRFTPDEFDGGTSCILALECTGETASNSQVASITIGEVNAAPWLTNLPTTVTGHWNQLQFFDVAASDASDVPPNPWTVTLGADDCSFAPWVDGDHRVRWECSAVESCTVEVFAVDQGSPPLSASGALDLVCDNTPPVLSTASATATAGETYTYDAHCTDADLDPVTLSVGNLDTCGGGLGATGPGQAQYTFTPPAGAAGTSCDLHVICSDTQDAAAELRAIDIQ